MNKKKLVNKCVLLIYIQGFKKYNTLVSDFCNYLINEEKMYLVNRIFVDFDVLF